VKTFFFVSEGKELTIPGKPAVYQFHSGFAGQNIIDECGFSGSEDIVEHDSSFDPDVVSDS